MLKKHVKNDTIITEIFYTGNGIINVNLSKFLNCDEYAKQNIYYFSNLALSYNSN